VVDAGDRLVDLEVLDHVVVAEREVLVPDVLDVVERARVEVVDADDAIALVEQVLAQVRAEEARAPGDDGCTHSPSHRRLWPALEQPAVRVDARDLSGHIDSCRRVVSHLDACDSEDR
jgi:hypothetical protein